MRFFVLALLLLDSTSWAFPSTGRRPPNPSGPPTFVQEAETVWDSAGTLTTSSFNVKAGDILVAYAGSENGQYGALGISGGSLTWTKRQETTPDITWANAVIWTAVVDTDKAMTVSFANLTNRHGGNVLTFRNSSGVGNSNKTQTTGLPSLSLTTSKANSAVVVFIADWNAVDGTSSKAYLTATAGSFTEQSFAFVATSYTIYGGYHPNAGAAGSKTVGQSAPAGQKYSIVAIEIKGP